MAAMAAILKNVFFASSPELKGQLTWNLVGSIGVTRRSKIAKIVPIVNPSWLPFRVCLNDHAQLTGMPYIFFKIKNCLNDDLFISCDDRIGKMLHNICVSAVAVSLRWATRGPWASCFFFILFPICPSQKTFGLSKHWNCLSEPISVSTCNICVSAEYLFTYRNKKLLTLKAAITTIVVCFIICLWF